MNWRNLERGNQVLRAARIATDDEKKIKKVLDEVGGYVNTKHGETSIEKEVYNGKDV